MRALFEKPLEVERGQLVFRAIQRMAERQKNSEKDEMNRKVIKVVGPENLSRERDDRRQVRKAVIVDIGNWTQRIPMCKWER